MSVDVFLLINLLALFHRNTALPARLPSSGRAPRTSCVIPEPRLPKLHSCFPTDHSDVSPGVHPHSDLPSCHQPNGYRPRLDKMVSADDSHLRGTHDQWLVKRLNPVLVVIGDFDGLFCGSALLGLNFEVPPTPAFLGVGPIGFWLPLALFPVLGFFVAGLCSCLSSVFSPLPWFLPPFLITITGPGGWPRTVGHDH